MSMMKFYISHEGQQMGPWTYDEVVRSLEHKKLLWSDYLYDEKMKDWVLLAEHPYFNDFYQKWSHEMQQTQKQQKEHSDQVTIRNEKEWYVLKGDNKFGPFAFLEVVRMLQEKNLYEFDYVWSTKMKGWKRVAECSEFSSESIKDLMKTKSPEVEQVFFRRRHARIKYGASVVVHNSKTVWRGKSLELSPGGAGLMIESSDIEPGQTLFLHFKVGDDVPPFNAICSVVSKQYTDSTNKEVRYGVKFTNISRDVQYAIKTCTEKAA